MKINVNQLENHRACPSQMLRFHELFGRVEVEITLELCLQHAETFDWDWAAARLLQQPEGQDQYNHSIMQEVERCRTTSAQYIISYYEELDSLWKEKARERRTTMEEAEDWSAPCRAAHLARMVALRRAHNSKKAEAFYHASQL